VELDDTFIDGYIQLGHCQFKLNIQDDAMNSYLRAIRVSNLTQKAITDDLVFQRLGRLYI